MRLFLLFLSFSLSATTFAAYKASDLSECRVGQECYIDLPGLRCGDGTQSYFTLTRRSKSKNLLIFMKGGGACWDESSCRKGFAKPLTRTTPGNDWDNGSGIKNASDPSNPFRDDYDIAYIPYCTGDAFTGSRTAQYNKRFSVNHAGYNNVKTILDYLGENYRTPQKAVLLGCSAGGIGAGFHLENFAKAFASSSRHVISDAGLPFKTPFVEKDRYDEILAAWGTRAHLPTVKGKQLEHFGDLIRYNRQAYPEVNFGFISSYRDLVMTFFSMQLGAPAHMTAVKRMIIDIADKDIGQKADNAKVFYTESRKHCHTKTDLGEIQSMGTELGEWVSAMLNNDREWDNVRPDLDHPVQTAADEYQQEIQTVEELWQHLDAE